MIQQAIHKVINKENLVYDEAKEVMKEIMTAEASQVQMATFLTALRMKGRQSQRSQHVQKGCAVWEPISDQAGRYWRS